MYNSIIIIYIIFIGLFIIRYKKYGPGTLLTLSWVYYLLFLLVNLLGVFLEDDIIENFTHKNGEQIPIFLSSSCNSYQLVDKLVLSLPHLSSLPAGIVEVNPRPSLQISISSINTSVYFKHNYNSFIIIHDSLILSNIYCSYFPDCHIYIIHNFFVWIRILGESIH